MARLVKNICSPHDLGKYRGQAEYFAPKIWKEIEERWDYRSGVLRIEMPITFSQNPVVYAIIKAFFHSHGWKLNMLEMAGGEFLKIRVTRSK